MNEQILRERYRAMQTEDLLQFAETESVGLTIEARKALCAELEFRAVDPVLVNQFHESFQQKLHSRLNNIEGRVVGHLNKTVLDIALNLKGEGKSGIEIGLILEEAGLNEVEIELVIERLLYHAKQRFDRAGANILTGLFIGIAGIALYLISPKGLVIGLLEILSLCAIAFGFLKMLFAYIARVKYHHIIIQPADIIISHTAPGDNE